MKTFYYVNVRTIWGNEIKPHLMFGIDAATEDGIVQNSVTGAFASYEDAEKLAQKCTELELAPEHLQDVIDDWLNS